jgi:Ser/Thr protein kinase RdoA (MazF antagonist)
MPVKEKPRAPSSVGFDERHLRALTDAYGLRGVDAFLPVILDGTHASLLDVRSETSRKALLEDDRGLWFVKQVPWYADQDEHLARRHAAMAELARHTGLVPPFLTSQGGRPWVRVDGAAFEISEYRGGSRFTGSPAQIRAAGSALAAVHDGAVDAAARPPAEDYRDLVADHVRLAREVAADRAGTPHRLLDVLDEVTAALPGLLPERVWERLPRTFVHGDYNPWNLVFGTEGVIAVVDFDNCDTGTRLRDVVEGVLTHAAVAYLGDSTSFAVPFRCDLDERRAGAFLSGYAGAARRPPTEDETAALPFLVCAVHVELVALAVLRGEVGDESAALVAAWHQDPPDLRPFLVREGGLS